MSKQALTDRAIKAAKAASYKDTLRLTRPVSRHASREEAMAEAKKTGNYGRMFYNDQTNQWELWE